MPASFDAVARELTEQAAHGAGIKDVSLLEEPQAAFYAWIERHPDWRERVKVGDLVLVVDIGGGTTDFTLIAVTEREGELNSSAWLSASTFCWAATTSTWRWRARSSSSLRPRRCGSTCSSFTRCGNNCRIGEREAAR